MRISNHKSPFEGSEVGQVEARQVTLAIAAITVDYSFATPIKFDVLAVHEGHGNALPVLRRNSDFPDHVFLLKEFGTVKLHGQNFS
jgi:hypothetical protein